MTALPKEPERQIQTADAPLAVAITNDGLLGFVALRGGNVAMFDLIAHRLVYTVSVGGTPHFIITGLYPPPIVETSNPVRNASTTQQPAIPQTFWLVLFCASLGTIVVVSLILLWHLRHLLKTGREKREDQ